MVNGWSLSEEQLQDIKLLIDEGCKNVLEFGSGLSTKFLEQFNINLTSFDNDISYAYKSNNVLIRNLIECNDNDFENMFKTKTFNKKAFYPKISPVHPRQKNSFYEILENDLSYIYDLVILDGPNGNGRSIAFLCIKNHVKEGTFIFIDDLNHYDFENKMRAIFNVDILLKDMTNNYGIFVITKIL